MIPFLRGLLLLAASAFLTAGAWLCIETIRAERRLSITVEDAVSQYSWLPAIADKHLTAIEGKADAISRQADVAIARLDARLASIQTDLDSQFTTANASVAAVTGSLAASVPLLQASASTALSSVAGDVHQVAGGVDLLTVKYAGLPDALAVQLAPSWASIQPEITCRHADGTGYGGCWHSRITGLFGEAEKVGGVFTQQFPPFAKSANGIALDFHKLADRTLAPKGFWGKVGDGINTGSVLLRGLGAVGVF